MTGDTWRRLVSILACSSHPTIQPVKSLVKAVIILFAVASAAAGARLSAAQDLSVEEALTRARESLLADPPRPDEAERQIEYVLDHEPDNLAAEELDLWRDYRFGSSFLLPFRTADRLHRARDILAADSTRAFAHLVAGRIRYSDFIDSYQTVRFRSFTSPGRAVGVDDRITDAAAYLFDTSVDINDGEAGLSIRESSATGWTLDYTSLSDAEHRYAEEAIRHLGAALDSDVPGSAAHRYLAEVLLHTDRLDEGILKASQYIESSPGEGEGWMLRGMFRAKTGNWSGADEDFSAAFERVPEQTRRAMTTPELFTEERVGEDGAEQVASRNFWLESDPIWSTEQNEALLEHVARMVEADLLFGDPDHESRGWNSDAGGVYVRYGPPVVTARYGSLTESYMLLHYGDRRFIFMMPGRRGSYTFYSPSATAFSGSRSNIRQWESDQEIAAREAFREKPRRSRVLEDRRLDVSSVMTRFGGDVPILAAAWCLPEGSGVQHSVDKVDRVELYALVDGAEQPTPVAHSVKPATSEPGPGQCPVHVIEAPAETLRTRYSLEVFADEYVGTVRLDKPSSPATDSMSMSDIMPASLVVEGAESEQSDKRTDIVRRGGHEIHPVGAATFERGRNLYLYFELYDTGTDVTGPVTARIQAALVPDNTPDNTSDAPLDDSSDEQVSSETGALERLLGRVFSRNTFGQHDAAPVSVDFEEQISGTIVNRYLILRTEELDPGRYVVAVRVSIPDSDRTTQSSRQIEITDSD